MKEKYRSRKEGKREEEIKQKEKEYKWKKERKVTRVRNS
jgi:hypothetical protein